MSIDKWNAHNRIHQTPVSRLEIDYLETQRRKLAAQSHLIPRGPDGTQVKAAGEVEIENKIHFQERRLARHRGRAKSDFTPIRPKPLRSSFRGQER